MACRGHACGRLPPDWKRKPPPRLLAFHACRRHQAPPSRYSRCPSRYPSRYTSRYTGRYARNNRLYGAKREKAITAFLAISIALFPKA